MLSLVTPHWFFILGFYFFILILVNTDSVDVALKNFQNAREGVWLLYVGLSGGFILEVDHPIFELLIPLLSHKLDVVFEDRLHFNFVSVVSSQRRPVLPIVNSLLKESDIFGQARLWALVCDHNRVLGRNLLLVLANVYLFNRNPELK